MNWTDNGIVLSSRQHGETSLIVTLLTREHGLHAGLVRGGAGRRARGLYQPGNLVSATWRARLPEHLGSWTCELMRGTAALLLDDADRLAGLSGACALAGTVLPEHEPHPAVYDGLCALLDGLVAEPGDEDPAAPAWAALQVRWEVGLLAELGFGLDLGRCAATGRNDNLVWVSPRTGRAVSASAGEPWRDRLLALPGFLAGRSVLGPGDVADGFALTGYFLRHHVLAAHHRDLPDARRRLAERFGVAAGGAPEENPEEDIHDAD